ncbi:DNA topoisomerase 1 isoform X2 [Eurosta solidaginis]|uniref:DNA topoisomerase 1 isoform X2 n=1 Tax=Eurosta solidaginis TaxID=178769 RepID=UPI003530CA84
MSVDVALENDIKTQNGSSEVVQVNGVSNGHHSSSSNSSKHKSSSKDKHRDKERDHKSSSSSSKDHKSSNRDKDKHHSSSSSSSKDKHRDKDKDGSKHSSSSSSSHRDKDRDKDKDKHKSSSSSSSSHHKSSSKDKEKRDKDRDRKESSSSSSKVKDKDKDKQRHHKSSSSSSSRDKDKDKDRHRSSSSSKHKHSSSSSSKSLSSSGDKAKLTDGEFIKPEPISQPSTAAPSNGYNTDFVALKPEPVGNELMDDSNTGFENRSQPKDGYEEKPNFKVEESNINISQASSCDYSMSQFKEDEPDFIVKEEAEVSGEEEPEQNTAECEEDDDEDIPLAKRKANTQVRDPLDDDVDDEEDIPLAKRKIKTDIEEDDDEDVPLLARKKVKKEASSGKSKNKKKRIKEEYEEDDYEESKPKNKKTKKVEVKQETASPAKRKKKQDEEEEEVWRWWEEEKREDGVKWNTLEHKGPVFAPPYERCPKNVRFFYDGKPLDLSEETEEAATFYAKMLNHDYCTKNVFNDNFFKDFRKTMISKEREIIKDFKKCNFEEMFQYFTAESEKRKNATKEEKLAKKLENEALIKEYGTCLIDGHKEKIGNFKLEPPGLFRGRGEHPKMGMIKRRIQAEDVSINCGKEAKVPPPPPGHRWKEVRHDNTVTWLASWIENVQGQVKYIMLNPSSKLKGEKDHIKYETARRLAKSIDKIRATYRDEWKSKEMRVRQRAVALYFIDKLALRAGNEKDEDQADTVGCCSLRVEHVKLKKQLNGKENVVIFDFLGKDSIRYYNEVEVEKRVYKNLELFLENKKEGDDLFDRLNTQVLNEHLKELMEGLTAKVFRTYNASITLQNQLNLLTEESMSPAEKLLAYNRANRAVAILCNHQRSVPKGHEKSMENLKEKIRQKRELIEDAESEYHDLKKAAKRGSVKERVMADKKIKQLERLKEQLKKLELQETDRDENKTIALGTSKLNYLDPRITVAWCKKHGVPIEKIFNKTQRNKFMWAIHMADENYVF